MILHTRRLHNLRHQILLLALQIILRQILLPILIRSELEVCALVPRHRLLQCALLPCLVWVRDFRAAGHVVAWVGGCVCGMELLPTSTILPLFLTPLPRQCLPQLHLNCTLAGAEKRPDLALTGIWNQLLHEGAPGEEAGLTSTLDLVDSSLFFDLNVNSSASRLKKTEPRKIQIRIQ